VTSLLAALVVLPVLLRLWHRPVAPPVLPEPRTEAVPAG
jgi:hypothetical protein